MEMSESKALITSLSKSITILRAFVDGKEEWGARELAAAVQLPRSSVYRLLKALEVEGLLELDPETQKWRAGMELYRFGFVTYHRARYPQLALPLMRELVNQSQETAVLGLYLPQHRQMTFASKVESPYPLRYALEIGTRQSLLTGATGKAILAFLPPEEVDAIIAQELAAGPPHPAPDLQALHRQLAAIRAAGYALTSGERIPGAVGCAAPVRDARGEVIGCLGLTVPDTRFQPESEPRLADLVRQQAGALSRALGYQEIRR